MIGVRLFLASVFLVAAPLLAQTVTYWPGGFGEHWTNPSPGAPPTNHNTPQPVSLCPDGNTVDQPPCPCPRSSGMDMGVFHLNGAIFTIFQDKVLAPSNTFSYSHYATNAATWVTTSTCSTVTTMSEIPTTMAPTIDSRGSGRSPRTALCTRSVMIL